MQLFLDISFYDNFLLNVVQPAFPWESCVYVITWKEC